MKPTKQLAHIVECIGDLDAITPRNEPIKISMDMLEDCRDHEAILDKLEMDHGAIVVEQRPNAGRLGDADLDLAAMEFGEEAMTSYMSYHIRRGDNFKTLSRLASSKLSPTTRLEPGSYDAANGVLTFDGRRIAIIKQSSRKGKNETQEARLMRLVFKDVNSMRNGVAMKRILSVRLAEIDSKKRKLIKNYVAEINKKINEALEEDQKLELIIYNQNAVMINSLYL